MTEKLFEIEVVEEALCIYTIAATDEAEAREKLLFLSNDALSLCGAHVRQHQPVRWAGQGVCPHCGKEVCPVCELIEGTKTGL